MTPKMLSKNQKQPKGNKRSKNYPDCNLQILFRIKEALGVRKQNQIAEKLGISQGIITFYLKNAFPPLKIKEFAYKAGCDEKWLLTGEGTCRPSSAPHPSNSQKASQGKDKKSESMDVPIPSDFLQNIDPTRLRLAVELLNKILIPDRNDYYEAQVKEIWELFMVFRNLLIKKKIISKEEWNNSVNTDHLKIK